MLNCILKKTTSSSRGFSLLEVLLGITVFMIGMLGVTALNISSLKSNTFSGNMSEAVIIAGDRLEKLMATDFDDDDLKDADGDGTNQDLLPDLPVPGKIFGDGVDDDGDNFGLDDIGNDDDPSTDGDADHSDPDDPTGPGIGRNNMYYVYWNVAEDEPLPERTKKVNVIVEWYVKDEKRSMSMSTIILDHD